MTPTPGQASYEARQAAKARRMGGIGIRWEELPAGMQADEEAGAQAALKAAAQGLLEATGVTLDEVTAAVMGVVEQAEPSS